MHIGERIKGRRERLGKTQDQLGDTLSVTRETISQWESGSTEPRPSRLALISETLLCNLRWLVSGEGPEDASPEPTEREREHLANYRRLSDANQGTVDLITRQLANHDDQSPAQKGR